jgi:thiol-disulfide isomerase/thioredoxin
MVFLMKQRVVATASLLVVALLAIGGVMYVKLHPSAQLANASSAPVNAAAQAGQKAPEFSMPTTAGPFDLALARKPVLLEIFATWCPHCQRETQVLNRLYARYGSRVAFVAVPGSDTAMDETSPASEADLLSFEARFAVKYPIGLYDPNLSIAKLYLKGGYPTIAIIDAGKTIVYLNSGEVLYQDLAAILDRVLKSPAR